MFALHAAAAMPCRKSLDECRHSLVCFARFFCSCVVFLDKGSLQLLAPHGTGSVLVFADSPYAPVVHLSFTPLHCSFAASGTSGAQALSSLSSFHFPHHSSFSSCLLFLLHFLSFHVSARAPLPLSSRNSPAALCVAHAAFPPSPSPLSHVFNIIIPHSHPHFPAFNWGDCDRAGRVQ